MKTLNRAAFAALLAFGFSSTAIAAEVDEVTITVDHPQSIAVNNPLDVSTTSGEVISVAWTITSNNAFDFNFTGTNKTDDGGSLGYPGPNFYKQDVDASGLPILNSYDNLDSRYGVIVTGAESTQFGTMWGGGANPVAFYSDHGPDEVADVVSIGTGPGPNDTIGTVMPGDGSGSATVTLYARGTAADGSVQSGNYSTAVTLTVTANEKLNP